RRTDHGRLGARGGRAEGPPHRGQRFTKPSRMRTTCSTMLSGVEAPDVKPIVTGPAGSQPVVRISSGCPAGLCRIVSGDSRHCGCATWYVGTCSAQMRARLQVLLLL